jgi:EamA domain-containing membrane protein RarD
MNPSQVYILISIIALLIIAIIIFFVRGKKKGKKVSLLGGLGLMFVLAGIIFGDNRLTGYVLIGIGVFLAIIDMIKKLKRKRK